MGDVEEVRFIPLDEETNKRLIQDNAGMYVEGFVKSDPGDCIVPKEFTAVAPRIRNMTVRKDDTWVVTFPKCGTYSDDNLTLMMDKTRVICSLHFKMLL
jgi:hypothetical protein